MGGGGGYGRTCATRDDEPRPVWTSLPITHCVLECECVYYCRTEVSRKNRVLLKSNGHWTERVPRARPSDRFMGPSESFHLNVPNECVLGFKFIVGAPPAGRLKKH
jgi:hypothetical protein